MSNSVYQPKISIITPSFNQGQFIEETILSVINQSYQNFELIVIDGGSTDNTVKVLEKYHSKIHYWISEKDGGQSEAINKGLKKASGDIITWLNSDDYYEKNIFEKVVEAFNKNRDYSIIHGKSVLFGENRKEKIIGLDEDIEPHEYLSFMRFPQPSSFFKKEVIEVIGDLNSSWHYAMDFDWIVKSVLAGFKIRRLDDVYSHYRLHDKSKSNNELEFLKEWSQIVDAIFLSTANGRTFAEKMLDLKIVNAEAQIRYKIIVSFSETQLETVFLQHLNLYFHHHYRYFNYHECKRVSEFLRSNYSEFYIKNKFKKYNFRINFIPKVIFKLVKKITNH